jgi:hypothetical protein
MLMPIRGETVSMFLTAPGAKRMTTMISEVYEAFKEANVSDATARKAAEAVAAYETRFASLDVKIERIDGRLTLIQWMLALLIGGVASLVIKAFI